MIFKDYIYNNDYLNLDGDLITALTEYKGDYDGYFQDHAAGKIFYSLEFDFLRINARQYNVADLKEVRYLDEGNYRTVEFIGLNGDKLETFNYEVFWIDEADIIEFAFGFPEDIERDLLKFISNQIK